MGEPTDITTLLSSWDDYDDASDRLFPLVYAELRAIAAGRMSAERPGHTLEPTGLVHEAYLKLVNEWRTPGRDGPNLDDRSHFFAAASVAMRRILVDHARKHKAIKRGGGRHRIDADQLPANLDELASTTDPAGVILFDEALTTLESEDERAASVVRLRFFAGLTTREIADILDMSERTVHREWAFARARLFTLLASDQDKD